MLKVQKKLEINLIWKLQDSIYKILSIKIIIFSAINNSTNTSSKLYHFSNKHIIWKNNFPESSIMLSCKDKRTNNKWKKKAHTHLCDLKQTYIHILK